MKIGIFGGGTVGGGIVEILEQRQEQLVAATGGKGLEVKTVVVRAASKAREADREAREAKLMAEAEAAQKQNMAAAAARGEEIRAQRLEKEAEEERRKEDEERAAEAAREAAREKAREQVESVEQTVDLDAQRDIMRQYEQQYEELGGSASPSSDFGF